MTTASSTWVIEPRDPLVLGHGGPPAAAIAHRGPLPPPNTVAGMVRAAFVAGSAQVSSDRAAELLERISIRGPWLCGPAAGVQRALWFPAPHDGVRKRDGFVRAALVTAGPEEGVLWSADASGLRLVHLPERGADGDKTEPFAKDTPLWPLTALVRWALGDDVGAVDVLPPGTSASRADSSGSKAIVGREHRDHVAIEPSTGTAVPGALFTSAGSRFERDYALAVEVTVRDEPAVAPPRTVVLGGESRLSFRGEDARAAFPSFDDYETRYRDALAVTSRPRGLRLQLLTPACLRHDDGPGSQAWRPRVPIDGLALVAACIPGPSTISGWDLQAACGRGAPRAVRRLVPAGSVYYYAFPSLEGDALDEALLAACRRLWGAPIEAGGARTALDRDRHLATPASDGFGMVLPGFWFEGDRR